ncbi:MAG: glycoside hydrolase domain-containing protein, partial [Lentisphaerota bacterium]
GMRATLGQLYLEIPVRNEYAKYYHYGYVYTALDKARGHTNDDVGQELAPNAGISIGKLNRYFELHPDGFMPFCAGFYLGSYDRGIQFFAENDKNWNNADENRAIEIRRDADGTRLNIHFMDVPTEISTPLDLTFGLIVTPLRDIQRERKDIYNYVAASLRKPESEVNDRRYYEACRDYGFTYARLYARMDGMFGAPRTYSASQLADFQRNAKLLAEYGLGYLYYSGWGISPNIPGCEVFAREMYAEPVKARGFGVFTFNLNSTYTDYYLAGVEYMVKNAGAKGVHLDSSQLYFNILSNELDGYGFSRKGRAHGSWPVFASREFSKRLYTMLNDGSVSPERGVINGGFSYPMYAFAGFINTKGSYEEYYHMKSIRDIRLDSFLFRSADLLNGVYGCTSWASYLKLPITENEFTTLNLLHGIAVSATGTLVYPQNTKEPYGRTSAPQGLLSRLFHDFNVADAKFWPYYLDDKLADTGNPAVYCTAHLFQGSKALVILANLNEKDIDTQIRFDWRKLGLDSKKTIIRDGLLPDITYPVDADGSCKIPIAAQLYRILRIEAVK